VRAIASLGCEGTMRAIASSMSPHASPQQGPTLIISAATAGGITTVQTVSTAAKALPTTPTRERQIAARVKSYLTDRAIFTLLRCTTGELFFSCCESVAAHFKHASTRQPRRKPTLETSVDNTAKLRPQALVLAPRAAGANQLLKPASTTPRSYSPGIGPGTTAIYMQRQRAAPRATACTPR
jgi:hypothetical protein